MFSNKDLERYSRQIILKKVGVLGQKKFQNAKVLVVGCGGLGTPVIEILCRAGIGEIGINLHHMTSTCTQKHLAQHAGTQEILRFRTALLLLAVS